MVHSREAAKECSPRRKPWGEAGNDIALKGRKNTRGTGSSRRNCRAALGLDGSETRPYTEPGKSDTVLYPNQR